MKKISELVIFLAWYFVGTALFIFDFLYYGVNDWLTIALSFGGGFCYYKAFCGHGKE